MTTKSRLWRELEPEVSEETRGGAMLVHPATHAMETPGGVLVKHAGAVVFVPNVRISDAHGICLATPSRDVAGQSGAGGLADLLGHAKNVLASAQKKPGERVTDRTLDRVFDAIDGLAGAVRRCGG